MRGFHFSLIESEASHRPHQKKKNHNTRGGFFPLSLPTPFFCRADPQTPAATAFAMPAAAAAPPNPNVLQLAPRLRGLVSFPSSYSSSSPFSNRLRLRLPRAASMSAEARVPVAPPAHPTYDLKAVINLALSEDAGDRGTQRR